MAAHPIVLDPDLQERIERAAKREVRSPEFLIRDAVELYLRASGEDSQDSETLADDEAVWNHYDGPVLTHEEFLEEGLASIEHSRRTGLHLTGYEVADWIGRLHTDTDAKLPECHT